MTVVELPIIDLEPFLADPESEAAVAEARRAAQALREFGALVVRDPRVHESDNQRFLDMVEDYFGQPRETKMQDVRADLGYQIGTTPDGIEDSRCSRDPACQELIETMDDANRPVRTNVPDAKWRFFHRFGTIPAETKFPRLNEPPVVPKAFPQWLDVMDTWGSRMHGAVSALAEMAAVGLGLPRTTFSQMAKHGPHLLAPTASDLVENGKLGTVLAGFHYDLNFLTIHGKSRYPGLFIWPRNSSNRMAVRIPEGNYLLVQAGKQFEILTGGNILAGYHEVVVTDATLKAVERAKVERPGRPLWRISSTFFYHIGSDETMGPLPAFAGESGASKYTPMLTGDYVKRELSGIGLLSE